MQILANEPSLALRRQDLLCRYFFKIKSFLQNPVHKDLLNDRLHRTHSNAIPSHKSVICRTNNSLAELQLPTQPVLPYSTPSIYSWCLLRPKLDTEFVGPTTKNIKRFDPIFREYVDLQYPNYKHIYTDGSKDNSGVGSAAVLGHRSESATPPAIASIYSAELIALKLATNLITRNLLENPNSKKFLICTDSLSAVQALGEIQPRNQLCYKAQILIHNLLTANIVIAIIWIPGHSGIPGNEVADQKAKQAATRNPEFIPCPYTDWTPLIKSKQYEQWKTQWNNFNSHLKSIYKEPSKPKVLNLSRKEGVIVNRLRLGHTNFTHSYLMDDSVARNIPPCPWCDNEALSIKHIFLDCPELTIARNTFLNPTNSQISLETLLGENINPTAIFNFLKSLRIFDKI